MRAVAMSLLGYGPDAEDVVQDAALTALRRIGDVRDPAAVGAWLRAVVRNAARMRAACRPGDARTGARDAGLDLGRGGGAARAVAGWC